MIGADTTADARTAAAAAAAAAAAVMVDVVGRRQRKPYARHAIAS